MELKTILTINLRLTSELSFQVQGTGQYCSFGRLWEALGDQSHAKVKPGKLENICWGFGDITDSWSNGKLKRLAASTFRGTNQRAAFINKLQVCSVWLADQQTDKTGADRCWIPRWWVNLPQLWANTHYVKPLAYKICNCKHTVHTFGSRN